MYVVAGERVSFWCCFSHFSGTVDMLNSTRKPEYDILKECSLPFSQAFSCFIYSQPQVASQSTPRPLNLTQISETDTSCFTAHHSIVSKIQSEAFAPNKQFLKHDVSLLRKNRVYTRLPLAPSPAAKTPASRPLHPRGRYCEA